MSEGDGLALNLFSLLFSSNLKISLFGSFISHITVTAWGWTTLKSLSKQKWLLSLLTQRLLTALQQKWLVWIRSYGQLPTWCYWDGKRKVWLGATICHSQLVLEMIPADTGRRWGTSWIRWLFITALTYWDKQPFTHTFTPADNLQPTESPINLTFFFLMSIYYFRSITVDMHMFCVWMCWFMLLFVLTIVTSIFVVLSTYWGAYRWCDQHSPGGVKILSAQFFS